MKTITQLPTVAEVLFLLVVVTGCAPLDSDEPSYYVPQPSQQPAYSAPNPTTATIQIISDPPGARIEVNDDYIGDAPCTVSVESYADYRFYENTKIEALPTKDGDYTQTKLFFGYARMNNPYLQSDKIPQRIFFDMALEPVSPALPLNIQNQ